ncbi:hypothetical protein BDZ89DRAFT_724818 [Hymenopellis radicata]|nr:hypothetical protein BDZ89DRAFT_724818 [Hymenopellis radicata]
MPPPSRPHPTPQTSPPKLQQPQRNKFLDVDSTLMPPVIPNWDAAMRKSSTKNLTNQNREPWKGAHTGYCLPDPNAIVGASSEETVAGQLRVLCKLWDILLYRLSSKPREVLTPRQWRAILTLETHTSTTPGTKATQNRQEMRSLLNACLQSANKGQLDTIDWHVQAVKWQGRDVDELYQLPLSPIVVRPILWELAEINFRWSLSPSTPSCMLLSKVRSRQHA